MHSTEAGNDRLFLYDFVDDESDDLTLFYVLTFDPPYLRDRYRVLKLSVLQ